jgi:YD repeat-containing protein
MNIQGENKNLELYNYKGIKVYSYYTYSFGFWHESNYDDKGKELNYKDSESNWYEYTYDEKGNQLTFKDSDGTKIGFDIPEYTMKDLVEKIGNFKLIK